MQALDPVAQEALTSLTFQDQETMMNCGSRLLAWGAGKEPRSEFRLSRKEKEVYNRFGDALEQIEGKREVKG